MDFESALYRVYDRSISGLTPRSTAPSQRPRLQAARVLQFIEQSLCVIVIVYLIVLYYFHHTYVGHGECLSTALEKYGIVGNNVTDAQLWHVNNTDTNRSKDILYNDDVVFLEVLSDSHPVFKSDGAITNGPAWEIQNDIQQQSQPGNLRGITKKLDNSIQDQNMVAPVNHTYIFFPQSQPLTKMNAEMLSYHHFRTVNITLPVSCFTSSSIIEYIFENSFGWDVVILNQLTTTLKSDGFLRNRKDSEYYYWSKESLEPMTVSDKLNLLFKILVMFFVISSLTAILVRVLNSSGVFFLFPILYLMQKFGVLGRRSREIFRLSYPWLGSELEPLENSTISPIVLKHLGYTFIVYLTYEANQFAWLFWFYTKKSSSTLPVVITGLMMFLEYYNLFYVRSKMTIIYYPKFVLAYFVLLHLYVFIVPFGFIELAIFTFALALIHLGIYFIRHFEIDAHRMGFVSQEQPRYYYNQSNTMSTARSLPPLLSMFSFLNARSTSAYEEGDNESNIPISTPPILDTNTITQQLINIIVRPNVTRDE